MVHTRINERSANPNPHINFISALPSHRAAENPEARELLRALAAQLNPVMKLHGFTVNSFEEVRPAAVHASLHATAIHELA
jgi:DNA-dependent metalloprotease WSS1